MATIARMLALNIRISDRRDMGAIHCRARMGAAIPDESAIRLSRSRLRGRGQPNGPREARLREIEAPRPPRVGQAARQAGLTDGVRCDLHARALLLPAHRELDLPRC